MGARAVLLAAVALTACGGTPERAATSAPPDAATCDTTLPQPAPKELADVADVANGNGELWVLGLPAGGVMEMEPIDVMEDGSLYRKLGWWRGVVHDLHIKGERIDAPAPPLRADVPAGYFTGFQATALMFPTQGCWKVTGRIGDGKPLTFVTLVVKR
jgi:hypothetical protein